MPDPSATGRPTDDQANAQQPGADQASPDEQCADQARAGDTNTGQTSAGQTSAGRSDLASVRRSYSGGELSESELAATWLEQLRGWYEAAAGCAAITDPNAMQLATVDAAGLPDVRTVLARGFDETGVVFYTNYDSVKGRQLAAHPYAAGVFAWLPLERQVRFRGPVRPVSREETAAYFASRPRGAQLGAWASPQSTVISGRVELESLLAAAVDRFGDGPVPPPEFWGGYRIEVREVEFWQGREFRLHDRLRFRRVEESGAWLVERLAP